MNIEETDFETDVVIVGYGAAGAAAAITAHDNGANVTILEKMPEGGGNSLLSGGAIAMPRRKEDSLKFADYMEKVCAGTTGREVIDAYVNGLKELKEWLKTMGTVLADVRLPITVYNFNVPNPTHPGVAGASELDLGIYVSPPTEKSPGLYGGQRIWGLLDQQVQQRGIDVKCSTPVKELITNDAGNITGVTAESVGGLVHVRARKGVIMSCGGFENNEALKRDNFKPHGLAIVGSPGNTGDGIRMVQKIGAELWHMSHFVAPMGFKAPEFEAGFAILVCSPNFITVDNRGQRFASEPEIESHEYGEICARFDNLSAYEFPRVPAYIIFDESVRTAGPLSFAMGGYSTIVKGYQWSQDNSIEIEKRWIKKSETLTNLAEQLSIDAQGLERTVANYNNYCDSGFDADFDRPPDTLKPIIGPPYYALPVTPILTSTHGGPRRDEHARILDTDGEPIPRLYGAGEFGSIWGFRYESATSFGEALVYGRIAGRSVTAINPL